MPSPSPAPQGSSGGFRSLGRKLCTLKRKGLQAQGIPGCLLPGVSTSSSPATPDVPTSTPKPPKSPPRLGEGAKSQAGDKVTGALKFSLHFPASGAVSGESSVPGLPVPSRQGRRGAWATLCQAKQVAGDSASDLGPGVTGNSRDLQAAAPHAELVLWRARTSEPPDPCLSGLGWELGCKRPGQGVPSAQTVSTLRLAALRTSSSTAGPGDRGGRRRGGCGRTGRSLRVPLPRHPPWRGESMGFAHSRCNSITALISISISRPDCLLICGKHMSGEVHIPDSAPLPKVQFRGGGEGEGRASDFLLHPLALSAAVN